VSSGRAGAPRAGAAVPPAGESTTPPKAWWLSRACGRPVFEWCLELPLRRFQLDRCRLRSASPRPALPPVGFLAPDLRLPLRNSLGASFRRERSAVSGLAHSLASTVGPASLAGGRYAFRRSDPLADAAGSVRRSVPFGVLAPGRPLRSLGAPSVGFVPFSRRRSFASTPCGFPGPHFVPSSAFLTPSTACSATGLAGLFRPAAV
jgi:hypothetical protein